MTGFSVIIEKTPPRCCGKPQSLVSSVAVEQTVVACDSGQRVRVKNAQIFSSLALGEGGYGRFSPHRNSLCGIRGSSEERNVQTISLKKSHVYMRHLGRRDRELKVSEVWSLWRSFPKNETAPAPALPRRP